MTHQEAPWVKARAGVALDAESTNIISQDNMRDFYKKLAAKKKV